MRRRSLIGVLAVLPFASALAARPLPERFDPARDAAADLQQALMLAQAQRKLVLVDVGGEWCSWCHVFDRFVASHARVEELLAGRFVLLKLNYSPQQRNEAVLSRFPKPRGYPHFYVLDAHGKVLASQASAELEGGNDYDEAKVLAFLGRQPASA
jgi:thiol:disulfide interchange protein